MKNIFRNLILFAAAVAIYGCAGYESAENDPLNARIYTLENGLKVYMTVNKETPRIQTYIAVRVGAKNDPSETTGLAHYFEHLMFKGTEQFGTTTSKRNLSWTRLSRNLKSTANSPIPQSALHAMP